VRRENARLMTFFIATIQMFQASLKGSKPCDIDIWRSTCLMIASNAIIGLAIPCASKSYTSSQMLHPKKKSLKIQLAVAQSLTCIHFSLACCINSIPTCPGETEVKSCWPAKPALKIPFPDRRLLQRNSKACHFLGHFSTK
jgi:hypothetical protein